MKPNIRHILFCLIFITILVFIIINFNLTNTNYENDNKSNFQNQPLQNDYGSTGKLFTGEKTRTYTGKRTDFQTIKLHNENPNNSCKIWGVVTTIFEISDSINKIGRLAESLSSWCLVIVLDKNGKPLNEYDRFSSDRIKILDIKTQKEMAFKTKFIKMIPFNHFSRKNIGYYYAISQGAEIIFDFDDDNLLLNHSIFEKLLESEFIDVLEYITTEKSFNPYPLMKPDTGDYTWPRGFPLDKIKNSNDTIKKIIEKKLEIRKIGIIQSLANHDPDVDAIYRLSQNIPLNFEINQKPVLIPKNSFSPFNAQATVWTKKAFWGLLLPTTVHGRVSDIWRGYIVERVLKESYIEILFSYPFIIQKRNPHNYLKDFQAELPLYLKTGALISFLDNWESKGNTWYNILEELTIELYEREFIEIEDIELYQLWIEDLLNLGINFDTMFSNKQEIPDCEFKPFCWKTLNWEEKDPPIFKCNQNKSMRFYDFNLHDGVMTDDSNFIEYSLNQASGTDHEVFHWNYKNSNPASGRTIHRLKNSPIKTIPFSKYLNEDHKNNISNLFRNEIHFLETDALIFGFLPADFQFFLQFNKSTIVNAAHRINLFRCSINETLDVFRYLKDMEKSVLPKHVIAAHYLYDIEYIYHYTGIYPILLPALQLDSINDIYSGKNGKLFINGHVKPKELIELLSNKFEFIHSDNYFGYNYKTISEMKAVIYLPYSISNYKFIDHYAMSIPIFSPTPRFAVELKLYVDRTVSRNERYCPNMSIDIPIYENSEIKFNPQSSNYSDELFWINFAEVYNLPCIVLFDSWEELSKQLDKSNFKKISKCMTQANKWRKFEALQNWCWTTRYISS